ncbi:MAG: hypothetical protein ACXVQ0_12650, partial [Actinomycetota bacterium]
MGSLLQGPSGGSGADPTTRRSVLTSATKATCCTRWTRGRRGSRCSCGREPRPGYPSPVPRIYTKTGDDGTTGRLYGGRVSKAGAVTEASGAIDETVAAIGV